MPGIELTTRLTAAFQADAQEGNPDSITKNVRNWPNATALKNIRLRKEDVPRKLLLLLYAISDQGQDQPMSERMEQVIEALCADVR